MTTFHTDLQDPTLVKTLVHLNELRQATAIDANERLFDQAELKLRGDSSLYQNEDLIINEFAPLILDIVRSDRTTAGAKTLSIKLLDSILDHYSFDQILDKFSMNLLIEGLNTNKDELRIMATHVLLKARPADIVANTSIVVTLVSLLSNTDSSVGLVNAVEQCLLQLAAGGELVRRRIKSDEVINVLRQIKADPKVRPRIYDLIVNLLPIIPDLPDDLYLISLEEFENEDDILLNSLVLSFYTKLLEVASTDSRISFVLDKIDEQIDFITRVYIDLDFKKELKNFFNLEPVVFLSQLSRIATGKFEKVDRTYKILNFAIDRYTTKDGDSSSVYLLAKVDPSFFESRDAFTQGFNLESRTIPIFDNMVKDRTLLLEKLRVTSTQIAALEVTDFMEVVQSLTSTDFGIRKLVNDWPSLMTRLLGITNVANPEIWKYKINILESLYNARGSIGVWSRRVREEYSLMKNGRPLTSEADVMDTTGP
ncbi:DEKNAAC102968 [Brettanomyces naardenensis]|uniref:DNA mismatch repair protein HSM3 n=1 Tax=Brettanomyces naardenensis TaxID=13370 RepID=A0A448YM04_BRENA|nr:DEKNAAC102968 [Brettanomyces naardenensis]